MTPTPAPEPPPSPPSPVAASPSPSGIASKPEKPVSLVLKSFIRAVRLVMILAILFTGWWLIDLYRNLFTSEIIPIPTTPSPTEGFAGPAVFATEALADGSWSVGESGWSLKRIEVAPADLPRYVGSTGEPLPDNRPITPLETELIELLRTAGATSRENSGLRVYSLMLRKAQVRVVTQPQGGLERIRLIQAIWTATSGFNVFEMIPSPPSRGEGATPSLLPLPPNLTVAARRWGTNGKLLAEFVGPIPGDSADPTEWTEAGWKLDAATEAAREVGLVTYSKGAEQIQVWRVSPLGGTTYLLLIRGNSERK